MTTRNLRGYEPPARPAGSQVWSVGVVQQSATPDPDTGWTEYLRVDPLIPADTDPTSPQVRDFEIEDDGGDWWYRVYFEDADGDATEPSTPVSAVLSIGYMPSVKQVASHIRNRTRQGAPYGGNPEGFIAGTFNPVTAPTSAEVRDVIREAANFVVPKLGRDLAPSVLDLARSVVALRAAMQVELSFYSEQVATQRSPYPHLKALYDEAIKEVLEAVIEAGSDGDPVAGQGQMPEYGGFPETAIGMEMPW